MDLQNHFHYLGSLHLFVGSPVIPPTCSVAGTVAMSAPPPTGCVIVGVVTVDVVTVGVVSNIGHLLVDPSTCINDWCCVYNWCI